MGWVEERVKTIIPSQQHLVDGTRCLVVAEAHRDNSGVCEIVLCVDVGDQRYVKA